MKNKILLGSITLLSAFILSACGNGEKKTNKTTVAPTTEVTKETTDAPTTTSSNNNSWVFFWGKRNIPCRYSTYRK